MSVSENYKLIAENIKSAAQKAGRDASDITLVAVTKRVGTEPIAEAIACGVSSVGENRVQEFCQKLDFFENNSLNIHLIGQLQTNKVKYVIGHVCMIQSVDRLVLLEEIEKRAAAASLVQSVLIEVNIGGEEQKGGVEPDGLEALITSAADMPHVLVRGLMCVPPAVGDDEVRRYFAATRELYERMRLISCPNVAMDTLSMGMSGDYMSAIAEGATMIRVGTALFGARA